MGDVRWKKPDATGRSSNKAQGRRNKEALEPEKPFVGISRALLCSPAWRAQSVNCRRLIDFLLVEHMNHSGKVNGRLKAPYDPSRDPETLDRPCLRDVGIKGRHAAAAIQEAEFLGLIRVERGGRWNDSNQPSLYRLTFLHTVNEHQIAEPPTNEWKQRTDDQIKKWQGERREQRDLKARRKQTASAPSLSTVPHLR